MKHICPARSRTRRNTFLRSACPVLAAALLANGQRASAATQTYDASGTSGAATFGSNTWTTATTPTDFTNTSGTGDVAFTNGNAAVFGGTSTGTAAVTLGSAITTAGITVSAPGYTFATGANTLTIGAGGIATNTGGTTTFTGTATANAAETWTITAGDTLQFNAAFTSPNTGATGVFQITSGGTTNITNTFSVAGKATLTGGGTFNLSGTETFGSSTGDYVGIASATTNVTAGTAAFASPSAFFIGNGGTGTTGTLNVTGGTASLTSSTALRIGDGFNGTAGQAGNGVLTVGGGTFTTGTTTTAITLGNNVSTGVVNLNTSGVFATNRAFAVGSAGQGTINFNGGTLQATGTALSIPNTVTTNIADAGGTIDPNTFVIAIPANFTHGGVSATDGGLTVGPSTSSTGSVTLSGILSQTGGLTYNVGGTLAGTNTYTGPTAINAFVDITNSSALGATGTGNGTTINTGGTTRFRDHTFTVPEAITINGGSFVTYNDPGTSTYSGAITLNSSSTVQIQPQAQTSTTTVFSGGFLEGGTASNLTITRSGAAPAASADVVNITGASTYGGTTTISDLLSTNTGIFSVQLSGGDNRLPVATAVTLGNVVGTTQVGTRLILGNAAGTSNQTLTGLTAGSTSANNAVVGGNAAVSTLTLNIPNGTTNTFAGVLGGAGTNQNNLALTAGGAGTLALSGANTYTGGTTVTAGMLTVAANSALGTGNVMLGAATQLNINAGVVITNMTATTLTLNSATTSIVNLLGTMGTVQDTVSILVVNGVPQAAGTYGAAGSGAANILSDFTGTGELSVTSVPEPSTWAMMFGGFGGLLTIALRRKRCA